MKFFVSKEFSTHMEGPLVLEAAKWMMSAAQGVFYHNLLGIWGEVLPTTNSSFSTAMSSDLSYC